MPLPELVRVKLSSEAAEFVALTPVVARDMPLAELLEQVLSATGPDAARVCGILKRGSLVSGATRYRWAGCVCEEDEIAGLIASLPGPEPHRPLRLEHCARFVLSAGTGRVEISREHAQETRLLKRRSFWQSLEEAVSAPVYVGYLYRDRSDHYRVAVSAETRARLQEEAALLRYDTLTRQIRALEFHSIEFIVKRA
jgi:hypothetical protein